MRRKDRLEPGALSWLQEQFVDELHISALTMMEIETYPTKSGLLLSRAANRGFQNRLLMC